MTFIAEVMSDIKSTSEFVDNAENLAPVRSLSDGSCILKEARILVMFGEMWQGNPPVSC